MTISRDVAAQLGQETLRIIQAGSYTSADGTMVDIRAALDLAARGTCAYPPEATLPSITARGATTTITVTNESTLAAVRRLSAAQQRPVALNFASAKHPGGGFLSGARAQEESLVRASGLYACLVGNPMYERHAALHDALYTSYALYSPDVPIFRDDLGVLLPQPHLCSFITAPAVNARVVLEHDPTRRAVVTAAMHERIARVLTIAAIHHHTALVLGAWGCGVFGNDPHEIATCFADALRGPFAQVFDTIIFAILDTSPEHRFLRPFAQAFG